MLSLAHLCLVLKKRQRIIEFKELDSGTWNRKALLIATLSDRLRCTRETAAPKQKHRLTCPAASRFTSSRHPRRKAPPCTSCLTYSTFFAARLRDPTVVELPVKRAGFRHGIATAMFDVQYRGSMYKGCNPTFTGSSWKAGLRTWILTDLLQPLHLACILMQSAPKE